MSGPLIRLDSVTCAYGGPPVVVDVSLDVKADDMLGIVGPSGAGKTTLLRCLVGSFRPGGGTVERRPDLRIGYVPQVETVNWNFPVTVSEVVLMARAGRRLPWASASERLEVRDVLERLGLAGFEDRHISALSGGQQQRVFLARALVRRPHLLLLDEPTNGADVATRHEILHLLSELHASGVAIVLTTHDLNGIGAHLPRLLCMNRRVVGVGPPREILTPEVLEETFGAPLEVLVHAGLPVVIDALPGARADPTRPLVGSAR